MMKKLVYIILSIYLFASFGCWMYSFSGVNFGNVKTATVYYFENKASIVNPQLAPMLTEKLQQKIIRESPLKLVDRDGDVVFQGVITGYDVRPTVVQAGETAATNSLIVTVKVKFTNNLDPEASFEKTFSAEATFDPTQNLSDVEPELIDQITDQLVDDIFNTAFSNW